MRKLYSVVVFVFLLNVPLLLGAKENCTEGARKCSEDAYSLFTCERGEWKTVECMREQGKLCENGACVEPWRYGSPAWSQANEDGFTSPTLAEKAQYYDDIARRLHIHPQLKWIMGVNLPCKPVECAAGQQPPCQDCTDTAITEAEATWHDVELWHTNENDGLWNALYIASQAFRYAVTKDKDTLQLIKTLLESEVTRMRITSVPGIFTRQYIPPGITGIKCPENEKPYTTDEEKDDNKWVMIRNDGCIWYVDRETKEWTRSDRCGLDEFADWCFLDNVSKDEYSGHMFMLGVVAKLVDDAEVQVIVKDLLHKLATHLIENNMALVDWDGRVTEHGRFYVNALDDYPGFNAAMALDFIKIGAEVTQDPKIIKWYEDCLLQKSGEWACLKKRKEIPPRPYTFNLTASVLYVGDEGCKSNYNNTSMHMLSLHNLIWYERDPVYKETYQRSLDVDIYRADEPRAVGKQNNAFFDFIWASQKKLGPNSDGPAYDAVKNGIRLLRRFPARKHQNDVNCPAEKCPPYCVDRFGNPTSNYARLTDERCTTLFLWWNDPYSLWNCKLNKRIIQPPADYLLAYWMGRYYGFITESM
ncbi:MAG: hypothetical protein AB1546_05840 [bacterium]